MDCIFLNFESFNSKDKSTVYLKFEVYDIQARTVYPIFTSIDRISLPDGVLPSREEVIQSFPRYGSCNLKFESYTNKEGRLTYRPTVTDISDWKYLKIK